jgi:hypothetical protein
MELTIVKTVKGKKVVVAISIVEQHAEAIDEYGYMKCKYRIDGSKVHNGKDYKDGQFHFYTRKKIEGVGEIAGIQIDDPEQRKVVDELKEKLFAEREKEKELIINSLISGEKLIEVSVVGCDWPHYQAWIDVGRHFSAQHLMEEATQRILKDNGIEMYLSNICKFFGGIIDVGVRTKKQLPAYAVNTCSEQKTMEYHSFREGMITHWEAKLSDILAETIKKLKDQQRNEAEAQRVNEENLQQAFAEELWIFDDEPLSRVGGSLLHSLGAHVSESKSRISVYTTGMVRFMKKQNPNTTYTLKNILKEKGFKWDKEREEWCIEYSEKNTQLTIDILKQYDTKANPAELGLMRCWECGSWKWPNELDSDGYCGC